MEAIRRDLGLTKPFHTRYFDWLVGALQFDFGTSFAKANFSSYAGTSSTANFGTVADQMLGLGIILYFGIRLFKKTRKEK